MPVFVDYFLNPLSADKFFQQPINCLGVFDYFVGLAFKGLRFANVRFYVTDNGMNDLFGNCGLFSKFDLSRWSALSICVLMIFSLYTLSTNFYLTVRECLAYSWNIGQGLGYNEYFFKIAGVFRVRMLLVACCLLVFGKILFAVFDVGLYKPVSTKIQFCLQNI